MRRRHRACVIALVVAASLAHAEAPPRVVLVEPSGPRVPASLLRLSIRFARPVEGAVLPRLSLRHATGAAIAEPFLEQELWSPDDRTLTVLLHPGRVKTGLQARDELGPILVEGDDVVLALDGRPLQHWHVDPLDESGPRTSAWRLSPVHAGSREALTVTLDAPVDGQDANYLAIADERGKRMAGRAQLVNGESIWTFTPDRPWQSREYRLLVRGTLEDSSGNRVGSRFETSVSSPAGQTADSVIPFDPSPPTRPISR
jgi:hypothetical protein